MISQAAFERVWRQSQEINLTTPAHTPEDKSCAYARKYRDWATQVCGALPDPPAIDEVHQVILLNTLKYFEFRSVVPKEHLNLVSNRGHLCIFHVFEETFQFLKFMILSLPKHTTLLLPKPAPPSYKSRYEIAGVPMGISEPIDES